jgi:hypothetical protein
VHVHRHPLPEAQLATVEDHKLIDFAAIIKVLLTAAARDALVKLRAGDGLSHATRLHFFHAAGKLLHRLRAIAWPARIARVAFL